MANVKKKEIDSTYWTMLTKEALKHSPKAMECEERLEMEKNMTDEEIKAIQNLREINGWLRLKSNELWNAGDTRQSKKCLQMVDKINYVMNVIAGKPLLTDDERMYIEDLIQPFKSLVFGIRKAEGDSENRMGYIVFLLEDYDIAYWVSGPYIPIGDMEFSGLELNKDYCFEELGIDAE